MIYEVVDALSLSDGARGQQQLIGQTRPCLGQCRPGGLLAGEEFVSGS